MSRRISLSNALFSAVLIAALTVLLSFFASSQALAAHVAPPSFQPAHSDSLGLSEFSAKVTKSKSVVLVWNTGTELQILGFNLWKRTGKGAWVQMNTEMIPALYSGQVMGNQYIKRDRKVVSGKTYSYKLEVVSTSGMSAFTEPIKVKIR